MPQISQSEVELEVEIAETLIKTPVTTDPTTTHTGLEANGRPEIPCPTIE